MIHRNISKHIVHLSKKFKSLTITGPRQSGKTTLAKHLFPDFRYVSLEELDTRDFAQSDPRSFLTQYGSKVIIDEIQRVPDLFSYLQTHLDEKSGNGQYIFTGSQNLLISKHVSQSMVGRTALVNLLPLEFTEIRRTRPTMILEQAILTGGYPAIYNDDIDPSYYYDSYVSLYLERDVRDLIHVSNLSLFRKCMLLLAGRVGQLLNLTDISNALGVDAKTIEAWVSVLETSFIAFRLQPYFENISKRVVKTPKIYFYDTGVVCNLLGIKTVKELENSPQWCGIFENFVITETVRFYQERSNLFSVKDDIPEFLRLVKHETRRATIQDIETMLQQGYLVGAEINSRILNNKPGFALHYVLIQAHTDTSFSINDPGGGSAPPMENRLVSKKDLERALGEDGANSEVTGFRMKIKT
jgi:predicted AAA+ superfamily ATPase